MEYCQKRAVSCCALPLNAHMHPSLVLPIYTDNEKLEILFLMCKAVREYDSMRKSIAIFFFILTERILSVLFPWTRSHSFPCRSWTDMITITFLLSYFCIIKFELRVALCHNLLHIFKKSYW